MSAKRKKERNTNEAGNGVTTATAVVKAMTMRRYRRVATAVAARISAGGVNGIRKRNKSIDAAGDPRRTHPKKTMILAMMIGVGQAGSTTNAARRHPKEASRWSGP